MSNAEFRARRETLVDLLNRDRSLLAKSFVHLNAYFDSSLGGVGVANLENELLRRRIEPFMLRRRSVDFSNLPFVLHSDIDDRERFEVAAASFLKEADHCLSLQSERIISGQYETFDGQQCYVRKRNNYLASLYGYDASLDDAKETRPVGTRGQGLSLFPYAKKCVCIAAPAATAAIQLRFVQLSWDVLVVLELSVPPTVEARLRESLSKAPNEPPFFVVFGRTHRPANVSSSGEPLDLNQGVLLGPAGQELCVHDKLTTFGEIPATKEFNFFWRPWPGGISEKNQKGKTVTVIETPVGVLCPLVCKDLLDQNIEQFIGQTHIDTIFLPSLSPQTSAHYDVAKRLLLRSWASVFVANRCLEPIWASGQNAWRAQSEGAPEPRDLIRIGASFFTAPRNNRKIQCDPCGRENTDIPYLLFVANFRE